MSLINLTTIGDSEKRNDPTKIGQFSSGQAYATALCLRNNIELRIAVDNKDFYSYSSKKLVCEKTNKSKDVIVLHHNEVEIETAFALQLGYNWEPWMILREFFSNMLDEKGYYKEGLVETEEGTVVTLEFGDDSIFADVWQNKHLYINEEEPLFNISDSVQALKNTEKYLRIYKQNILVYEDKDIESLYAYNIRFGEIDERRILRDLWSIERTISEHIIRTENKEYIQTILGVDFKTGFLSKADPYYSVSNTLNEMATEYFERNGDLLTYNFIKKSMRNRSDCKINGRVIRSISDSIYSYSQNVSIDTKPVEAEKTLKEEIFSLYNIDLKNVDVKKAKLTGSKVIADKHNNSIIVDENFDLDKDFNHFIVEFINLTEEGNTILNLANKIKQLIKK